MIFAFRNIALSVAWVLIPISTLGTAYAGGEPSIKDVHTAPMPSVDGKEVIVKRVDYPPGFSSPSHYHTGHVVVYVIEGTGAMTIDGEDRIASAGEVMQAQAGEVMVMHNKSASEWLRFTVFQVGPEDAPFIVRDD